MGGSTSIPISTGVAATSTTPVAGCRARACKYSVRGGQDAEDRQPSRQVSLSGEATLGPGGPRQPLVRIKPRSSDGIHNRHSRQCDLLRHDAGAPLVTQFLQIDPGGIGEPPHRQEGAMPAELDLRRGSTCSSRGFARSTPGVACAARGQPPANLEPSSALHRHTLPRAPGSSYRQEPGPSSDPSSPTSSR